LLMFTSSIVTGGFTRILRVLRTSIFGRTRVTCAFLLGLLGSTAATAQQLTIINPSFEEFAPGYDPGRSYRITSPSNVIGWNSISTSNGTTNRIEHWRTGFLGVPAPLDSGDFYVELNPSQPVFLYQDVCLVEGATLNWSFFHRARAGGPAVQTAEFLARDSANALVQLFARSALASPQSNRDGTWMTIAGSSTFAGVTGTYRVGFESRDSGSYGNLLDNISLRALAQVEFSGASGQDQEDAGDAGLPKLLVAGDVPETMIVRLSIDPSSTAIEGADFAFTSSDRFVTIPAGIYDGNPATSSFDLPITILDDAVAEPDEVLQINLSSVTAPGDTDASTVLELGSVGCTGRPVGTASYTILDNDAALEIEKTAGPMASDVQAGDEIQYTFVVANSGYIPVLDVTPVEGGIVVDGTAGTGVLSGFTLVTEAGFVSTDINMDGRVDVLARGETAKFTATYTLSADDITAMQQAADPTTSIDNTATATGTPTAGILGPVTPSVVETGVLTPAIVLEKAVSHVVDTNGSGLYGDEGDIVHYVFRATNTGNAALANITVADDDLALLTGLSTLTNLDVSLGRGDADITVATATYVLGAADIAAGTVSNRATIVAEPVALDAFGDPDPDSPLIDLPLATDDSDTGSEPLLEPDGTVVRVPDPGRVDSNGIAGDDSEEPTVLFLIPTLGATKTTTASEVLVGQTVPYVITISSAQAVPLNDVTVVDTLPTGMVYAPGTARIDGTFVEPVIAGQTLSFAGLMLSADGPMIITLSARVTGAAPAGDLVNTAGVYDGTSGVALTAAATAMVTRRIEAVFACSHVIGKVFDDVNMNGYQDPVPDVRAMISDQAIFDDKLGGGKLSDVAVAPRDEIGIPNVRLVTPSGTIITTDAFGRYSVPCAELPADIGSNFMLKLDTRTLPTGYRVTTENPRVMRLTAGLMTEMNFGAAIGRVFDVDLSGAAFARNQTDPSDDMIAGVAQVLRQIADTPTLIRISYYVDQETTDLAQARVDALENMINDQWSDIGNYRLMIETTINQLQ
jgi:uncharacterized repeat protein (TIGR01451 family)